MGFERQELGAEEVDRGEVVAEFWRRGQAAMASGRVEEARAWFEAVVALDDGNVTAWLRLAELIPDGREALACYARVLELDPGNEEARAGIRQARKRLTQS